MSDSCYIYVASHVSEAGRFGVAPCKVGITGSFDSRISSLQTGNPRRIQTAGIFLVPSREMAREIEADIHSALVAHRTFGEWFDVPPARAMTLICSAIEERVSGLFEPGTPEHAEALRLSCVTFARTAMVET